MKQPASQSASVPDSATPAPVAGAATIVARDVSVVLRGRAVLRGVSAEARAGEVLGVVGPNGAGKSTLLRALAGLLQPQAGSVMLAGQPIAAWQRAELARRLAYLPQDRVVHWPLAAGAVVALGRLPHRGTPAAAQDAAAIAAAMAAMDVTPLSDRPVTELSGGERARVLLARALAQGADTIIADEPTAGLDPAHTLGLFAYLSRLAREGRAVVAALHDLSAAVRYCDRLLVVKDGSVLASGPPRAVLTPELLAAAYGVAGKVVDIEGVCVVLTQGPLSS